MAMTSKTLGAAPRRGFGYRPRRYGLNPGLQGGGQTAPYFGAKGSGILASYGGRPGGAVTGQPSGAMYNRYEDPDGGAYRPPQVAKSNAGAQASGGQAPQQLYSFESDPVLAKIRAMQGRARNDAIAQAAAARKQLAIDYGDAGISGDLAGDTLTAKAASDNPFSVLAQLRQRFEKEAPVELDEAYNQRNLFFSGARAQGMSDLAREYQQTRADTDGQFRGLLSDIDGGLQQALMQADMTEQDAYLNWLMSGGAGLGGYYGGGGESGAGVGFAGGPAPSQPRPSHVPASAQWSPDGFWYWTENGQLHTFQDNDPAGAGADAGLVASGFPPLDPYGPYTGETKTKRGGRY